MFAILFEVLLIENQEEIHHFAGWEGGGSRGTKIVNKHFVNKLAFPRRANVAVQLLQRSIPKTAAQLPFSLVACCRGGV